MAFTVVKPSTIFCLLVLVLLHSSSSCKGDNVLYTGETLNSENYLEYGSYSLRMQSDCNLVLYDNEYPVWSSGTYNQDQNCRCTMQTDGNLVIYTPSGAPIWASNTGRADGFYVLILQKDRNLVIYGTAIWATATNAYNVNSGIPAVTVVNNIGGGNANLNLTAPKLVSAGVAATA
ncbi:hypothetical protein ACLOJK_012609 [Asimina triloba]